MEAAAGRSGIGGARVVAGKLLPRRKQQQPQQNQGYDDIAQTQMRRARLTVHL